MGLLELLPAFFEFDLLHLVVDGLGFCIGFRMALEFLELLDPLAVGFDRILQRLTLGMDFCNGLQCIELIGLEKVHGFAESIQVLHPRFWPASFSRLAAGSSVLIVHPSESVFQNAQPQNLFLRLKPGAWGSASNKQEVGVY